MDRGVVIALCVFGALVLITLIVVIAVTASVSSIESRREDGENE